jgi:HEPN domain-containing protein
MNDRNREEALVWLREAGVDLAGARSLARDGYYSLVCFHAQQCGEKALKAVLYARGERPWPIHSVRKLAEACRTEDPGAAALLEHGRLLDRFYILTRYPNGLPGEAPSDAFVQSDAGAAFQGAEAILAYARGKLEG